VLIDAAIVMVENVTSTWRNVAGWAANIPTNSALRTQIYIGAIGEAGWSRVILFADYHPRVFLPVFLLEAQEGACSASGLDQDVALAFSSILSITLSRVDAVLHSGPLAS